MKLSATAQEAVADTETDAEVPHEDADWLIRSASTAVAQPVPITSSLTSRISMAERDANSSPLAPSSKAAVTLCDPRKTPLAL